MDFDFAVIGAGSSGLAAAAALAPAGSVLIVEREAGIGRGASSRNSEVVHAGLYYPPGSLKARLCVAGRRIIEEWARAGRLPYARVGKLLVAADDPDRAALERLWSNARANGVGDLTALDGAAIRRREPAVRAEFGLLSPSTAIVDSHALLELMLAEARAHGAELLLGAAVTAIRRREPGFAVSLREARGEDTFTCGGLVNAAGLHADRVASLAGIDVAREGLEQRWCRGEYFRIAARSRVRANGLIYPAPRAAGGHLGIHVTVDLAGALRLGPTHEYLPERPPAARVEELAQDERLKGEVWRAAAGFLPELALDDLEPCGVGIRARLNRQGEPARDFVIREESANGLPGLVNLIGIDSPGLTAAPAIGRLAARLLAGAPPPGRA